MTEVLTKKNGRRVDENESRRGAQVIADHLEDNNYKHVFALCGHGNIGMLDALYDRQASIDTITVHHEQVAGHMADAYYRVAGRPAVTLTSCGPGSANLPVAVASAMMDSSAVLAITGNVSTQQFNRDPFQETGRYYQADFPSVMRPYVKRSFQPTRSEQLPLVLRQAEVLLRHGRPGPVHVDVPLNLFIEETTESSGDPDSYLAGLSSRSGGDPAAIEKVAALLTEAERPVLLAGAGVYTYEAVEEFRELAESLRIPVVSSPDGKGVMPYDHDLYFGAIGRNGTYAANEATRRADLLISVASLLDDRATSAWIDGFTISRSTKLVQIDLDPRELSKNLDATVGILGNPVTVLSQLRAVCMERGVNGFRPWLAQIQEYRSLWEQDSNASAGDNRFPMHPKKLLDELRAVIPWDANVLSDVGVHHNWIVQHWKDRLPNKLHQSWGFASMGFGVAGVLGAALADPTAPAVTICGDAGFLMVSSAVLTAVQNAVPAVWVVWDNQSYGSIYAMQRGFFGERELGTRFYKEEQPHRVDISGLARSYGANGVRVDGPDQVGDAVAEAIQSGEPSVVHVPTDGNVSPVSTGGWVLPPLPPLRPTYVPPIR